MINKVYKTICEYRLIDKGDKIVIGLSGGADSMCLTHILWSLREKLGISLCTVHLNHGIRGAEADSDEESARAFSESLGIPFSSKCENVPEYAKIHGMSEELAGREIRYAFFDEILKEKGFNKIATAHNRNDNAETILMNFMRGSGLKGLGGIPHKRGNVIRPILDITRDEIEKYCKENGIEYVTDKTNNEKIYTRNKIRLDLIPQIMDTFNPNFINTVTENAKILSSDSEFIDDLSDRFYKENIKEGRVDIKLLSDESESVRSRVIKKMIVNASGNDHDLSGKYISDIEELIKKNKSGSSVNLPYNICAMVEYGKLYIGAVSKTDDFIYEIPLGKKVYIPELNKTVYAKYTSEKSENGIYIGACENDKIEIRNRREGDVFYPEGMQGKKKIKDYFIDSKIPRFMRDKTGIITVNGEIAYIFPKRYDRRFTFRGKGIKITLI